MPDPFGPGLSVAETCSVGDGSDASVVALVKWFDPLRGFGFVLASCGTGDALLHGTVLRRDGLADPEQGDRLRCVIGPSPRGLQVLAVLGFEPSEPDSQQGTELLSGHFSGRVKFYDAARGYGFVRTDDGAEVFVGAKLLRKLRLTPLREDQAVRLTVLKSARGLVAETLTFT